MAFSTTSFARLAPPLLTAFLISACDSPDSDFGDTTTRSQSRNVEDGQQSSSPQHRQHDDVATPDVENNEERLRNALRDRLHRGTSSITLPERDAARNLQRERRRISLDTEELQNHLGSIPSSGHPVVTYESSRGLLNVMTTEYAERMRAISPGAARASRTSSQATHEQLQAEAIDIMEALGADASELDIVVDSLVAIGGKPGSPMEGFSVAKKAWTRRVFLGVPVDGEKVVHTFALDGTYLKSMGWWREIDLEQSILTTDLSAAEIMEIALDTIAAKGVQPGDLPIDVGTYFVTEELDPGVHRLRLVGYVVIHNDVGTGDGTEGKASELQFSIE